jgi:hypothetical protein
VTRTICLQRISRPTRSLTVSSSEKSQLCNISFTSSRSVSRCRLYRTTLCEPGQEFHTRGTPFLTGCREPSRFLTYERNPFKDFFRTGLNGGTVPRQIVFCFG